MGAIKAVVKAVPNGYRLVTVLRHAEHLEYVFEPSSSSRPPKPMSEAISAVKAKLPLDTQVLSEQRAGEWKLIIRVPRTRETTHAD